MVWLVVSARSSGAPDPQAHGLTGPVEVLWEERHDADALPRFLANPARPSSFFSVTSKHDPHAVIEVSELDVTDRTAAWTVRYGGEAGRIAVDPQGRTVFVAGATSDSKSLTLAIDAASGELLWESVRPTGALTSMAVSPDGSRLYMSGSVAQDFLTLARDAATGEESWATRYDGPGSDRDTAFVVTVAPDGATVFVVGRARIPLPDGAGVSVIVTVAYDASDGSEKWHAVDDDGVGLGILRAVVAPDGSAVLTRFSDTIPAYDARSGELLWSSGWGHDLALEGHRAFVTASAENPGGSWDFATRALDVATGAELWTALYDGPASRGEHAFHLAVDPAGGTVAVSGSSDGEGVPAEFATVAYDTATGEQRWVARYRDVGTQGNYFDVVRPIYATFSADGAHLIVFGDTREDESTGIQSGFVIAYAVGLAIDLDVRPGSRINAVNPRSRGVLPVALLGSARFDVGAVDLRSVRLGQDGAAPIQEARPALASQERLQDLNRDGFMDLVLHFRTSDTGIAWGDESVTLTGITSSGTKIEGSDSISTVGCSRGN